jgi:hypothetical protein
MIEKQDLKVQFSKTTNILLQVAGIIGAITIIAGGYTFYLNYVWKPKVTVLDVDFINGIAHLQFGSKIIEVSGDSAFLLGGDWGIKFGSVYKDGILYYDRLLLVRKGMVYEYLNR